MVALFLFFSSATGTETKGVMLISFVPVEVYKARRRGYRGLRRMTLEQNGREEEKARINCMKGKELRFKKKSQNAGQWGSRCD